MSSYQSHTSSKPRNKVVKPILRKFTPSEHNSLDLDRPAAEQDGLGIYNADFGAGSRSARDVTFDHSSRRGYHHRSTSGTSQFSTGTTGSHRAGSFVHPFQQTPRPYTPPLGGSHQSSLRQSESFNRDSPTLSDNDLEQQDQLRHHNTFRSTSNLSTRSASGNASPIPNTLRIQTTPYSPRVPNSHSQNNLSSALYSPDLTSPTDTTSPISAMRTSMDKGFRMVRTRSDVESRPHAESIQEARRKFQEKERLKEEKAAREEIRAREKRDQKEAKQIERGHRRSSASDYSRTNRSKRSKSDLSMPVSEKGEVFESRDYQSTPASNEPWLSHTQGQDKPRRSAKAVAAKKKSHSAWTKFMMWLRTRLLRMKKRG
ncbi:hypothetical protein BP6252_06874 [Coleophoma cylindrospora]|uniref:Uncharacterized protein n=1 Tax=Coleophoma cylindrospora TaxID=1849047 RepID=A0A3D8RG04_9HELO|nr:hypothetical protein BP6252_06874 [Coleophoma cylindrospora]